MGYSLKKQGFIAFAWDFAGKLANQGMGLIVSIFLARLLEPAEFGLIAMVMVFVGIAAIFTDIGLGSALIQKRRVLPIHYSSVFYFNLSLGTLLTLILFFSAPYIADFYHNDAVKSLAQVLAFSFIINSLGAVQGTKLRKELNYAILTKSRFIASAIAGSTGVGLAFSGFGVWSLVVEILLSQALFVSLIWKQSGWIPNLAFSFKALKKLWAFGFRMFLSGVLNALFSRLDYMFIGKFFPSSTLGFFQRAKSLNMLVIQYSSGSLMSVMFPLLSQVQHDLPRFKNIILKGLGLICFIVFLLLGGLYSTAHEIILILFGAKWEQSVDFFRILALSGFGYPVSALLVNVLSSRGNSKAFLRLEIYKKLLALTNFAVLYFLGLNTFLYYLVFTSTIAVLINAIFVKKEIGIDISAIFKPLTTQAILAIMAAVTTLWVTKEMQAYLIVQLFIKGGLFLFLYWILNVLVRSPSYLIFAEEIKPLISKIKGKLTL